MSLNYAPSIVTAAQYEEIFARERVIEYPMVNEFEQRHGGFAIERDRLEDAARVLSCPFKAAPPNWQHGRVIYAMTREYVTYYTGPFRFLDIGTAKGFSALSLLWGFGFDCVTEIDSVDVMDPQARVRRNTVAEVDGLKTLVEILAPWPEARHIRFHQSTGIDWLKAHRDRVNVAFVDGKHDGAVVAKEGKMLADRQESGDVIIFDDVQIPALADAVAKMSAYEFEYLEVLPGKRKYAIGVRR